ncbi:MAG: phage terminase large subunit family protein, partial [Proteobacteria bacterium]|nr:phage terminase large subunit family protein [Pseudomonadota bacterium]
CRDGLGDEPDMFQAGAHKDFHERLRAYDHLSKELYIGKPIGTEEESWIWGQKSEADIRLHYEARCPACSTYQEMKFEQIKVPEGQRDPKQIRNEGLAWYECEHCKMRWTNKMRDSAVKRGRWKADKHVDRPGVVFVHLPAWYSRWVSLSTVMSEWFLSLGDPEKMKAWWNGFAAQPMNTVVAETDEARLRALMVPEMPPLVVPDTACAVTVSVDMQKDHFFYSTMAHAYQPGAEYLREDWVIDNGRVGSFSDLHELIYQSRFRQDGSQRQIGVWRAGVDTGGGQNEGEDYSRPVQLYNWLLTQTRGTVYGTKGMSHRNPGTLVKFSVQEQYPNGKPMKRGLRLYFIDSAAFKDLLFWRLGEEGTEPIHFHGKCSDEYFRQIVSEKKVLQKGKYIWKKFRANHWLDCLVGHLALTHFQWVPSFESVALALFQAQQAKAAEKPRGKVINPYTGEEE